MTQSRFGRWIERHEKEITALSAVGTAAGILFAAISSFLSWQQLQLINAERATPYRAILYSTKIESYKTISTAVTNLNARYRRLLDNLEITDIPEKVASQSVSDDDREDIKAAVDARIDLEMILERELPLWMTPKAEIAKLKDVMLETSPCPNMLWYYRNDAAHLRHNKAECDGGKQSANVALIDERSHQLVSKLQNELMAVRLQVTNLP